MGMSVSQMGIPFPLFVPRSRTKSNEASFAEYCISFVKRFDHYCNIAINENIERICPQNMPSFRGIFFVRLALFSFPSDGYLFPYFRSNPTQPSLGLSGQKVTWSSVSGGVADSLIH